MKLYLASPYIRAFDVWYLYNTNIQTHIASNTEIFKIKVGFEFLYLNVFWLVFCRPLFTLFFFCIVF